MSEATSSTLFAPPWGVYQPGGAYNPPRVPAAGLRVPLPGSRDERESRFDGGLLLWLTGIALAATAVRIAVILATPDWSLTTDGRRFFVLARSGMEGTAFVPPLYPLFVRLVWRLAGDGIPAVRLVQAVAGGVTVFLTGLLAGRLAPEARRARRCALWGAGLAAAAPSLVFTDVVLLGEWLTGLLLMGFLVATDCMAREGGLAVRSAVVAGVLSGLSALTRAPLVGWIGGRALLAGLRAGERRGRVRAAAVALAALATIAPWTLRNAAVFGRLVPVSTNGGYNFWKSFHPSCEGTENSRNIDYSVLAGIPEGQLDAWGFRQGLVFIRKDPLRVVPLALLKQGYFWGTERLFAIGVRDGTWGPMSRPVVLAVGAALALTQLLWLLLAPAGLAAARAGPLRSDVLLLIAWTAATHLVFIGEARYHMPLVPMLLAASAGTIAGGSASGAIRGWTRLRLATLTAAIALPIMAFWAFEVIRAAGGRP